MNTIVERLKKYIDYKGVAVSVAEKNIGVSNSSLSKPFKFKTTIKTDTLEKFLIFYSDISPEWLLTGRGEMLKPINENEKWIEDVRNERTEEILNDPNSVYRLKTDNTIENQSIPLYNLEATAGIVTLFKDSHEIEPIDYIQIPNLPKCDGAVYISGDSMYPLLKSGDIVMYKQIHDIKDGIYWGEMYLISMQDNGDEMVMVKYIKKSDRDGYIKLVSQNKHHEDREVLLKKVKALALIKASIRINSMS